MASIIHHNHRTKAENQCGAAEASHDRAWSGGPDIEDIEEKKQNAKTLSFPQFALPHLHPASWRLPGRWRSPNWALCKLKVNFPKTSGNSKGYWLISRGLAASCMTVSPAPPHPPLLPTYNDERSLWQVDQHTEKKQGGREIRGGQTRKHITEFPQTTWTLKLVRPV